MNHSSHIAPEISLDAVFESYRSDAGYYDLGPVRLPAAFVRGMGSVIDLSGANGNLLVRCDECVPRPPSHDRLALGQDWRRVRQDMARAARHEAVSIPVEAEASANVIDRPAARRATAHLVATTLRIASRVAHRSAHTGRQ